MSISTDFDKSFITARVNQCLSICESQLKYGCDVAGLFEKSFRQGLSWLDNHASEAGFSEKEIIAIEELFMNLRLQRVAQVCDEIQSKQVSKPAPPAAMSVLSVLGQVTEARPVFQQIKTANGKTRITTRVTRLSPVWYPSFSFTAQLFSNTRPVGGLGQ